MCLWSEWHFFHGSTNILNNNCANIWKEKCLEQSKYEALFEYSIDGLILILLMIFVFHCADLRIFLCNLNIIFKIVLSTKVDRNESYDLGLRLKITEPSVVKGESGSILRVLGYIRHTGVQQFHAASRKHSNDPLARANPDFLSLSAWPEGEDTVKVIGSKAQLSKLTHSVSVSSVSTQKQLNDQSRMSGRWECSMRAIQLIQAYLTTFPKLFRAINTSSRSQRFFKIEELFSETTPG